MCGTVLKSHSLSQYESTLEPFNGLLYVVLWPGYNISRIWWADELFPAPECLHAKGDLIESESHD